MENKWSDLAAALAFIPEFPVHKVREEALLQAQKGLELSRQSWHFRRPRYLESITHSTKGRSCVETETEPMEGEDESDCFCNLYEILKAKLQ